VAATRGRGRSRAERRAETTVTAQPAPPDAKPRVRHHDAMSKATDPAIDFLLASPEPAIRHAALTRLLGKDPRSRDVRDARARILGGPWVSALLAGQRVDGSFGNHPYAKWTGAHWRLAALMDLDAPADTPGLVEAHETVLHWLGPAHVKAVRSIDGRARRCGSQEGNALAVGVWLGRAGDPRVVELAANLVRWQWPDGGWNCDIRPEASHSSFNESWLPLVALARFADATGDRDARHSADRAAEFFLRHHVVYSERTGDLAHPSLGKLHYPPYWHYDLLAGLRALAAAGRVRDDRTNRALDLLESRRHRDGLWHSGGRWWRADGRYSRDVVDWGSGRSEPITLAALAVLEAAGRRTV